MVSADDQQLNYALALSMSPQFASFEPLNPVDR
jgi:hypothetical protein